MDKEKRIYLDEDTRLMIRVSEADDKDAFAEIYVRYFFAVADFISSLDGRLQASEDITQDAFTDVWENRKKYHPTSMLKTFLFSYAKNAFYRYRTKKNKENTLFVSPSNVALDEIEATNDGNENNTNEYPRLPEELISQLPDKQKRVFEMMYLCGAVPKEVAKQLKCSLHSVHQNLHLARKNIRRLLTEQVPPINETEQKNKKNFRS